MDGATVRLPIRRRRIEINPSAAPRTLRMAVSGRSVRPEAVWGVDTFDEQANLTPYFERTSALGFGSQEDYERDLEDPKWLER